MTFPKLLSITALSLALATTSAHATGGCSFFAPGSGHNSPQFVQGGGAGRTAFTVVAGDKTTVTGTAGTNQIMDVTISWAPPGPLQASQVVGRCTTGAGGSCTATGISLGDGLITVQAGHRPPGDINFPGSFATVCEPGGASDAEVQQAANMMLARALGQQVYMSSYMSNRRSGGGTNVSSRNITLSTSGPGGNDGAASAWFAIEGAGYDGIASGSTVIAGGGIEYDFGGTIAGIALSYGKTDLTSGTTTFKSEGLAFSPYFMTTTASGLEIDGFLSIGRPDVDYGGGNTASSDSLVAGLTLRGDFTHAGVRFRPYGNLGGFKESIDAVGTFAARDISRVQVGLGSRIEFAAKNGFEPWIDVGFDAYRYSDNLAADDSGFAPKLGVGFNQAIGDGTLSLSVDLSQINDDLNRYSVSLGYALQF